SRLSTWLTRILINEALSRRRALNRRIAPVSSQGVVFIEDYRERMMRGSTPPHPDEALFRVQIRRALEAAVARLPETFRVVLVLRDIENLTLEETAEVLGVPAATVKTRHFRARRRLQAELDPDLKSALQETLPFAGATCAALTDRVVAIWCRSRARL